MTGIADSTCNHGIGATATDRALDFEIVRIVNGKYLIDSGSYRHHYQTADARPLGTGHYIVLWASVVTNRGYDGCARFIGPFRSTAHARLLLRRYLEECMLDPLRSLSSCFVNYRLVRCADLRAA